MTNAGHGGVEVGQELLQAKEVPRRLGDVRRDVDVRLLLEGAWTKKDMTRSMAVMRQAMRNSARSRWGQVRTVSSGRLSTRTMDSWRT